MTITRRLETLRIFRAVVLWSWVILALGQAGAALAPGGRLNSLPTWPPDSTPLAFWVLVSAVAVLGLYRVHVAQMTHREQELLALVRRRTLELEQANRGLMELATHDELTGAPNQRLFKTFVDREWSRAMRYRTPVSLIMVDIDNFKAFNDAYGHQAGDGCLRQVAKVLTAAARRPTDLVARYGGEEFVAVLVDTNRDGAAAVAERMRSAVEALGLPQSPSLAMPCVTISLGVATGMANLTQPHLLLGSADAALYDAKNTGRNRVSLADTDASGVNVRPGIRAALPLASGS